MEFIEDTGGNGYCNYEQKGSKGRMMPALVRKPQAEGGREGGEGDGMEKLVGKTKA